MQTKWKFIFILMFIITLSLPVSAESLSLLMEKARSKLINVENYSGLQKTDDLIKLADLMRTDHKSLILYLQEIPSNQEGRNKIFFCSNISYALLTRKEYNELLHKILQSSLNDKVKMFFCLKNMKYITFNYLTESAKMQIKQMVSASDNEAERKRYLRILDGDALLANINLFCSGTWNEIAGTDDGVAFEDNFSEEMSFLRDKKNIYLIWYAVHLPQLKAFLVEHKEFSVNVDATSISSYNSNDLESFILKSRNVIPTTQADKEAHLGKFIQLSLFAVTEIQKKVNDDTNSKIENSFWMDCLKKANQLK